MPALNDKQIEMLAIERVRNRIGWRMRLPIRELEAQLASMNGALAEKLQELVPELVNLGRMATRRTELELTIAAKRAMKKPKAKKAKRKAKRSKK